MTSAREEILGRVRAALAQAPAPAPINRSYRSTPTRDLAARIELFAERVADYRAEVVHCEAGDVLATITGVLPDAARVVVPEGLAWSQPDWVVDSGQSADELDTFDAVVTTATVGIAETGTIVLTHGVGEGRRAITLVPDIHVIVIAADQIVDDVVAGVAGLDPQRPTTWISGPSATSDIELNRVEGVHGPRTLRVIIVGRSADVPAGGMSIGITDSTSVE